MNSSSSPYPFITTRGASSFRNMRHAQTSALVFFFFTQVVICGFMCYDATNKPRMLWQTLCYVQSRTLASLTS